MSVMSNNVKSSAKDEITKSIRDLLTVTITLPLGNPNLKLVHTNQFIYTEFPKDLFELANFGEIAKALNSTDSRYSGYQINRWYIEKVRIRKKVNGTGTMELTLNPFASILRQYRDNKHNMEKAYSDAMNKNNATNSNKSNKTVKSTTKNKLTVKQALKEVGKLMEGKKYSHAYQKYSQFKKYGKGDCWAASYFIACELEKRGVKARIIQYATRLSPHHRSVQYKDDNGKWHDFPYRSYKIHSWFRNTPSKGTPSKGTEIKKDCS